MTPVHISLENWPIEEAPSSNSRRPDCQVVLYQYITQKVYVGQVAQVDVGLSDTSTLQMCG